MESLMNYLIHPQVFPELQNCVEPPMFVINKSITTTTSSSSQIEDLNYDELLDMEIELRHQWIQVQQPTPVDSDLESSSCVSPTVHFTWSPLQPSEEVQLPDRPITVSSADPPPISDCTISSMKLTSQCSDRTSDMEDLSSPPSPVSPSSTSDKPATSHRVVRPRRRQRQLFKFLVETLADARYCPALIEWVQRDAGVFRFVQPRKIADLWGERRQRKKMTYEHLSRAMRYYYTRGIMRRVGDHGRLVYQFLQPNAQADSSTKSA